jgi:hypothetical protein
MLWCTFDKQYPFNFLNNLSLFGTYEDWLMGAPKLSEMPDLVKRWETAASGIHPGWPVYTAIRPEDYKNDGFLPDYVCIGFFASNWTREPNWNCSAVVIVWYQEKSPIDGGISLPRIKKEVWESLAKDFNY